MKKSQKNIQDELKNPTPVKFGVIIIFLILIVVITFFSGIFIGALYATRHHDFLLIGSMDHHDVDNGHGVAAKTNRILPKSSITLLSNKDLKYSNDQQSAYLKLRSEPNNIKDKSSLRKDKFATISSSVVVKPTDTITDIKTLGYNSLHIDDKTFMKTPTDLDNDNILLAAWVYLDEVSTDKRDMRTIFSNKAPGCEKTSQQYGLSMYVNTWQTSDKVLYVEYGNEESGCHKLSSSSSSSSSGSSNGNGLIQNGQWHHVAVYFNVDGSNILFINGEIVQSNLHPSTAAAAAVGAPSSVHKTQISRPFVIGHYNEGLFPLFGNISSLLVAHPDWRDMTTSLSAALTSSLTAAENKLVIAKQYVHRIMTVPQSLVSSSLSYLDSKSSSSSAEKTHHLRTNSNINSNSNFKEILGIEKVVAFYPLTDTHINLQSNGGSGSASDSHSNSNSNKIKKKGKLNTIAHDLIQQRHGVYVLPRSVSVDGSVRVQGVSIPLVNGLDSQPYPQVVTLEDMEQFKRKCLDRQSQVKAGMVHVWGQYHAHAWGADELKPLSRTRNDNWGGMGMTILDSLDTLYIMDMQTEFAEAVRWITDSLTFNNANTVSTFEITIRALGGMLSAYSLSQENILLTKAQMLGDLLLPAFNTMTGIPYSQVNFKTHTGQSSWNGADALLAELGTLQIEFRALSYYTKNPIYEEKCMKALKLMSTKKPQNGLFPMKVNLHSGSFSDSKVTIGAMGDSFYEYLLKVWLQGGRKEAWIRRMYDDAVEGILTKMLKRTSMRGFLYVADLETASGSLNSKMDHLACFFPGILALGAYTHPQGVDSATAQRDLEVAKALMFTCYEMYHSTPTHISPEYMDFPSAGQDMSVPGGAGFFILRPETAESLFVLAQLTGEIIYREWAWEIFTSIEQNCRVEGGYATLRSVTSRSAGLDDRMESFFLAETMKYLYLAQDTSNKIDILHKYVLNTEAHPIRVFDALHTPVSA